MHAEAQQLVQSAPPAPAPAVQQLASQLDAALKDIADLKEQNQKLSEEVATVKREVIEAEASIDVLTDGLQYAMQPVFQLAARFAAMQNRQDDVGALAPMPVGHCMSDVCM